MIQNETFLVNWAWACKVTLVVSSSNTVVVVSPSCTSSFALYLFHNIPIPFFDGKRSLGLAGHLLMVLLGGTVSL